MSKEMVKCKNCGEENYADDIFCKNCKVRVSESIPKHLQTIYQGNGYIDALKVIGWIELICSVIMAIKSWSNAGNINKYMYDNLEIVEQMKSTLTTTGLMYLIGGVIIFCLLMALNTIGKTVIEIRRDMNR